jgi:hypothetical protein
MPKTYRKREEIVSKLRQVDVLPARASAKATTTAYARLRRESRLG